jgi:hypothetical protein
MALPSNHPSEDIIKCMNCGTSFMRALAWQGWVTLKDGRNINAGPCCCHGCITQRSHALVGIPYQPSRLAEAVAVAQARGALLDAVAGVVTPYAGARPGWEVLVPTLTALLKQLPRRV